MHRLLVPPRLSSGPQQVFPPPATAAPSAFRGKRQGLGGGPRPGHGGAGVRYGLHHAARCGVGGRVLPSVPAPRVPRPVAPPRTPTPPPPRSPAARSAGRGTGSTPRCRPPRGWGRPRRPSARGGSRPRVQHAPRHSPEIAVSFPISSESLREINAQGTIRNDKVSALETQ